MDIEINTIKTEQDFGRGILYRQISFTCLLILMSGIILSIGLKSAFEYAISVSGFFGDVVRVTTLMSGIAASFIIVWSATDVILENFKKYRISD